MDRRTFLKTSFAGTVLATTVPATWLAGCTTEVSTSQTPPLRLSFQENTAPGETLTERLDFMEAHGVVGLEPSGRGLGDRLNELQQALRGRNIQISAICAGFSGFILAEDPTVRATFDRTMKEIIAAAGELGSTGVIMVPAFNQQTPVMPHNADTRAYLVEQLTLLGEYALQHGTTVILEPLNRSEAFYLRQVADAASICRDTACDGVRCMGDFWHMTAEESSDYGALYSGGPYLRHIHIASRGKRRMPGEDGERDNYVEGFRALKQMNYPYYVSFECGSTGDRAQTVPAALTLLRTQWDQA